jgi:hypothetical protein
MSKSKHGYCFVCGSKLEKIDDKPDVFQCTNEKQDCCEVFILSVNNNRECMIQMDSPLSLHRGDR